eukprot:474119-Prorocentrum_minimum.AAC.1
MVQSWRQSWRPRQLPWGSWREIGEIAHRMAVEAETSAAVGRPHGRAPLAAGPETERASPRRPRGQRGGRYGDEADGTGAAADRRYGRRGGQTIRGTRRMG